MRLTVIGCSGSMPGPASPASCYLVEADGYRLVLDLGNGAIGPLSRHVALDSVDAVALTHLHADHCLDLCAYYVARKYGPAAPLPSLPVWGPAGTAARMARAYDLPEEPGMASDFDFGVYADDGVLELGPLRVTTRRVVHPVLAYGLRIECDGKVLAYTGDTAPCDNVEVLARDADVLLAEASFRTRDTNPPDLHLTGREAGEHAARAGVDRLVLTHVPPWFDPDDAVAEAVEVHSDVRPAAAGLTIDV